MRTLVIGNKCYSSWSLRPWLLLKTLKMPFEEVLIPLDQPDTAQRIARYSPAGRVPVLIDQGVPIWDSLAIVEHLAEYYPARVYPEQHKERALARSLVAEMHAGFGALRGALPMNLGKKYAWRERPGMQGDVKRIQAIVKGTRKLHGADGPFLFGEFTAVDAYYAPVMTRFDTYGLPVDDEMRAYMDAILALPAFQEWKAAALEEPWIIADDEVPDEPVEVLRKKTALA